jgi:hypothetical protein
VNKGGRSLDFISQSGNLVAMLAIIVIVAAYLLGVGSSSLGEMLDLEEWLSAAKRFLRKL